MKKMLLIFCLGLALCASLYGQTFTLTVQNQTVTGTELHFDIYMLRTGGTDIYLGNADFVLEFNHANFTSPAYEVTDEGVFSLYFPSSEIKDGELLILNLQQPAVGSDAQFASRIQQISNTGNGTKIASVKITNITNPAGTSGLQWRTAGDNRTVVNTVANSDPWGATDISGNGTYTNPSDTPLPVQMAGLMARSADRQGVVVQWSTAAESQTLGFNVHRSDSKEGVYNLINPVMIPAKGEQSYGAEYEFIDRNVSENAVYWYKIEELAADGSRHWYGPISAEGVNAIPQAFDLSQNYPNPFNPSTTVQYQLPEADMVNIAVYSMLGQTVKVLLEEQMEAGYHEIQWDGTDSRNQLMPSGVYFLQVRAGTHVRTRKLILLR